MLRWQSFAGAFSARFRTLLYICDLYIRRYGTGPQIKYSEDHWYNYYTRSSRSTHSAKECVTPAVGMQRVWEILDMSLLCTLYVLSSTGTWPPCHAEVKYVRARANNKSTGLMVKARASRAGILVKLMVNYVMIMRSGSRVNCIPDVLAGEMHARFTVQCFIIEYGSTLYVGMARKKMAANTNIWQACAPQLILYVTLEV